MEPRLTMWPPSRMCGRQSRVMRTRPFTFVPKTVSSSSSLDWSNGARPSASPALLIRMSSPPSCSTAEATKRALLSASRTSSSSAISVSRRSTRRAPPATRTPVSASARAVARPKPDDAPVTIAVLPRRSTVQANHLLAPRDVIDLQGGVLQAEALLEQPLQPPPRVVAVGLGLDEHVCRERREAARHRPHVQVVYLDDVVCAGERARHRIGIDARRCRLEEDAPRVAQERPARAEHEGCDDEAGKRVEAAPARGEHEPAGNRGRRERGEIGGDVQERAANVQAAAVGP